MGLCLGHSRELRYCVAFTGDAVIVFVCLLDVKADAQVLKSVCKGYMCISAYACIASTQNPFSQNPFSHKIYFHTKSVFTQNPFSLFLGFTLQDYTW